MTDNRLTRTEEAAAGPHFFTLFFKKLRLSDPWKYKAPVIIGVPYFMILATDLPFSEAIVSILLSFLTILGIAGIAYYLNDLTDAEQDRQIGKYNPFLTMSKPKKVVIFTILLLAALAPWLFLPINQYTLTLLAVEFGLFGLYSLPPFRLKERGLAGAINDSLYAHALPAVLAGVTFYFIGGENYGFFKYYLLALGIWQFCIGLRNIILHQIEDYENDRDAEVNTFVVAKGVGVATAFIKKVVIPMEILAFIGFAAIITVEIKWFGLCYLAFLVITFWRIKYQFKQPLPVTMKESLYTWLDDFYIPWIPVIMLFALCLRETAFLLLLVLHIVFFKNALSILWQDVRRLLKF